MTSKAPTSASIAAESVADPLLDVRSIAHELGLYQEIPGQPGTFRAVVARPEESVYRLLRAGADGIQGVRILGRWFARRSSVVAYVDRRR